MAGTKLFMGKLQILDLIQEMAFLNLTFFPKSNTALNCKATSSVELAGDMDMEIYFTNMNEERLQLSSSTVFRKLILSCSLLLQR